MSAYWQPPEDGIYRAAFPGQGMWGLQYINGEPPILWKKPGEFWERASAEEAKAFFASQKAEPVIDNFSKETRA